MAIYHICYGLLCACSVYALVYSLVLYFTTLGISSLDSGLLRLFQRITQPTPTVTDNLLVQIIIAISAGIAGCTTITGFYLFCYDSTTANARRKKRPSYYNPLMVIPLVTVVTILAALSLNHFHPIERIESGAVTLVLVLAMTITILLASRIDLFGDSVMFRRLVWKAVTWLFILSIPWEFFRLYRHQVAEQFTHVMKGVPSGCIPSEPSWWSTFKSWLMETFTWSRQHSMCLKYHKAMLVEPMWEVTPLMVVTSLITRCITQPAEIIATSLGNSYRLLFEHIPLQWQPVVMIHLVLLTTILVLTMSSYRIRIPLFLNIEPHHATVVESSASVRAATTSAGCRELPVSTCR